MNSVIDSVIVVDRLVHAPYPEHAKCLVAPSLEKTGPSQYDVMTDLTVRAVAPRGMIHVDAEFVVNTLHRSGHLQSCLGIHDGLAIQSKGIETFRAMLEHLELEEIHLWRSVVSNIPQPQSGLFFAPCPDNYLPVLLERNGAVIIEWRKFDECKWFRWINFVFFTALEPKKN